MLSLRLALRALRWRTAASVTVFMVALVGITAAAVGPIYLHAVDETVLTNRLLSAPQTERDLRIERNTTVGLAGENWHVAMLSLGAQAADPRYFDRPVYSEQAPVEWHGLTRYATELAAIDGLCQHVRVVAGSCLSDTSERGTVVTQRTATQQHLSVGQVLPVDPTQTTGAIRVQIVGIVAPIRPHGAYWRRGTTCTQSTPSSIRSYRMSGGQQQRVAVARALVGAPEVLLADEPTAELDAENRERIVALLSDHARSGAIVLVASHDPDVVAACDDVLELDAGLVVAAPAARHRR